MSKVVVERPRLRFPLKNGSAYPRGSLESAWAPDFEASPLREAMGRGYGAKRLNENLQPLVRFLRSCVGRPWNDVHSEIAARISCKSAVQKHVLDHLRDYVRKDVRIEGSSVFRICDRKRPIRSWGMRFEFYVHPDTGILCLAPNAREKRRRADNPDRRVVSHELELWRIGDIWYAIGVARIPCQALARAGCFDVVARARVEDRLFAAKARSNPLWRTGRYAASKRQLSTREIVHYRLRSPK
jgi:hypothetical protein